MKTAMLIFTPEGKLLKELLGTVLKGWKKKRIERAVEIATDNELSFHVAVNLSTMTIENLDIYIGKKKAFSSVAIEKGKAEPPKEYTGDLAFFLRSMIEEGVLKADKPVSKAMKQLDELGRGAVTDLIQAALAADPGVTQSVFLDAFIRRLDTPAGKGVSIAAGASGSRYSSPDALGE